VTGGFIGGTINNAFRALRTRNAAMPGGIKCPFWAVETRSNALGTLSTPRIVWTSRAFIHATKLLKKEAR
jgi:hypothetical protein